MFLPSLAACVFCSFWASEANGDLLKKLFGGFLVLVAVFSLAAKIVKEVKKTLKNQKRGIYIVTFLMYN